MAPTLPLDENFPCENVQYSNLQYRDTPYGKEQYGKEPYGKEPYGKERYGKERYRFQIKEPYGKEPYGKEPYGYHSVVLQQPTISIHQSLPTQNSTVPIVDGPFPRHPLLNRQDSHVLPQLT